MDRDGINKRDKVYGTIMDVVDSLNEAFNMIQDTKDQLIELYEMNVFFGHQTFRHLLLVLDFLREFIINGRTLQWFRATQLLREQWLLVET